MFSSDYHFLHSGSHLTVDGGGESGGRRDTGASLDSVGASSGSLSPLEPPSPLFPPDGSGGEGSLTSEVFLNVLKLNQNRKRQENRYGTHRVAFCHMVQAHVFSHLNLHVLCSLKADFNIFALLFHF